MTIPIISDSHGRSRKLGDILQKLSAIGENATELIFLGDGATELIRNLPEGIRLYAVYGNCDNYGGALSLDIIDGDGNVVPAERIEEICGKRVFMTHGHKYGVKGGLTHAISRAALLGADILLFGHTHEPYLQRIPAGSVFGEVTLSRDLHVFNPGALENGSFGVLTVRNGEILLSHGRV